MAQKAGGGKTIIKEVEVIKEVKVIVGGPMDAKKEAELKEMDAIKKENAKLRQQKAE